MAVYLYYVFHVQRWFFAVHAISRLLLFNGLVTEILDEHNYYMAHNLLK